MDFTKWPLLKFSKFLNAYIFGTNALMKVSKHMFLWSSNPINMSVEIYKDVWLTKSKMATLCYNWIWRQRYYQSIHISAWWCQVHDLRDSLRNIEFSPYGKHLPVLQSVLQLQKNAFRKAAGSPVKIARYFPSSLLKPFSYGGSSTPSQGNGKFGGSVA